MGVARRLRMKRVNSSVYRGNSWLVSNVFHLSDIYKAISMLIKPHFVGPINLPLPRDTLISRYSPIIGLIQLYTTCPANNLEQLMHRTRFHHDIRVYQALFARLIRKLFSVNVIGLFSLWSNCPVLSQLLAYFSSFFHFRLFHGFNVPEILIELWLKRF